MNIINQWFYFKLALFKLNSTIKMIHYIEGLAWAIRRTVLVTSTVQWEHDVPRHPANKEKLSEELTDVDTTLMIWH